MICFVESKSISLYVCMYVHFFYMYVCLLFGECAEVTRIFGVPFVCVIIEKTSKSIIFMSS